MGCPVVMDEQNNRQPLPEQDSNLDLLRTLAVLFVLADHVAGLYSQTPFWGSIGHFGVLIFFVHTSLVLMMSLERMAKRQKSIVWPFYIQRVFRIYPLSILCVVCALLFHIPVNHFNQYANPPVLTILGNLLLIQNVTGGGPISGPMWSLPYEMQMYLALPLIFLLLQRYRQGLVVVVLMVVAVLCASAELLTHLARGAQYFPCFMGGIIAFWLLRRKKQILPSVLLPVSIVGLAICYTYDHPFLNLDGSVYCVLIGSTIGLFRYADWKIVTIMTHTVAKYSYGIYLAHMPLLWVCFHKLPVHSEVFSWVAFLLLLPITVFLLFHVIENPMIKLGKALSRRGQSEPGKESRSSVLDKTSLQTR